MKKRCLHRVWTAKRLAKTSFPLSPRHQIKKSCLHQPWAAKRKRTSSVNCQTITKDIISPVISKYAVLIWFFRSMSQLDQTWDLTCTSHHPARSLHSTKMVRFSCRNLLTKSMKSNFFHRMWHSWFWASLRQWLQLKLCSFADYQTKMISMWFFQMIFVRCHVLSRRWVIRLTISHIHFLLNRFD